MEIAFTQEMSTEVHNIVVYTWKQTHYRSIAYYRVINDIILLDYHMFKVPIFDYDWANITNSVKAEGGFTLVNLHHGLHQFKNDPFILAQAKRVLYWRVCDESNWYVVLC
ncbi:hypothetical protein DVH24_018740 [Malus domestica]|uniref:DUF4216 domain-containing protein n=1 Tax=Malus domestica TaxID=3750 RepID=A0A498HPB1_MALDO|nr:hypothetical protein DVH24_018740 [Malus domestica]